MKNTLSILFAFITMSLSGHAVVLVSEDFESIQAGDTPDTSAWVIRPKTSEDRTAVFTWVTSSATNTAGTGNGLHLYDEDAGDGVDFSKDFAANLVSQYNAVRVDFSFAYVANAGAGDDYIKVALGQYAGSSSTIGSTVNRYTDARLYNDGTIDFKSVDGAPSSSNNTLAEGPHTLTMFANDSDVDAVDYTGPNSLVYSLPANSVAYWLDGEIVSLNGADSTFMMLEATTAAGGLTVGTSENNLGRVGFVSSGSDVGLNYVLDDLVVSTLGEVVEADYLVEDDYEHDTVGAFPLLANVAKPETVYTNLSTLVVGDADNTAGTGNALRLLDDKTDKGLQVEYHFAGSTAEQLSAVRADFVFSCEQSTGSDGEHITVAFGEIAQALTSSSRRWTDCRLYADGTIDFRGDPGADLNGTDISTGSHSLSIFANDDDATVINYTGPDGRACALAANTVAYWLDNALVHTTELQLEKVPLAGGTIATTTNNFGSFGFVTDSAAFGLDYIIDDLTITELINEVFTNEPSALVELVDADYDAGQTVGTSPTGATFVRPSAPTNNCFTFVANSTTNTAGIENGVHIYDQNTGEGCMLTYNFVTGTASELSAVRIDFDFVPLITDGDGSSYIAVAVGEYSTSKTLNASSHRWTDARLYNNGTIDFRTATDGPSSTGNVLSTVSNSLSIFINDNDSETIPYTGLDGVDYVLGANSVAYWLNGTLTLMASGEAYTDMDTSDTPAEGGTIGDTANNLGKFGFNSGASDSDLSYVIDNLSIYEITADGTLVEASFDSWVDLYPSLGASTNYTDDADADGIDNLLEYALGGSPAIDDADDILPTTTVTEEDGEKWMNYVYTRRLDAATIGMTYAVLSGTELSSDGLVHATEEAGVEAIDSEFETVTNRISIDDAEAAFMRLTVEISK